MRRSLASFSALVGLVVAILASTAPSAGAVAGFGDVWSGRFYTEAVQWMVESDITKGITPECFGPEGTVTRGQAAAFMWRMAEELEPGAPHGLDDVHQDWQQSPVAWMVEQGITFGVTEDQFAPERGMNRAELATFLWRLEGSPSGAPAAGFVDVPDNAFFASAVDWMADRDITRGTTDTTFSPERTITRGEVATMLHRYVGTPAVTVDPGGAPCSVEYIDDVHLSVHRSDDCVAGGKPVVMTGGPSAQTLRDFFVERGYVVAVVDWRQPGYTGSFDAATLNAFSWSIHDLAIAVQWVRAHHADLCAHPDQIAAVGYSYGAITSMSLAYTEGELDLGEEVVIEELGGTEIAATTLPGPPPNLAGFSNDVGAVVSFAGFALADTIDPGEPPALMFHGTNDPTIPYSLAEQTCDALQAAAITCELVVHSSGHSMAEDVDAALEQADTFLRLELGVL